MSNNICQDQIDNDAGLHHGLAPSRWQHITWDNDDPGLWCISTACAKHSCLTGLNCIEIFWGQVTDRNETPKNDFPYKFQHVVCFLKRQQTHLGPFIAEAIILRYFVRQRSNAKYCVDTRF